MEHNTHPITLGSRIYKESSMVNWRIKGFNLMPFIEDHPVCGPWFMLGKNRNSCWSMVMNKQVHGGVENIGFKLMRADDETMWDMVTFSLGLKTDDGWFVSCIENQVVGKESNNPYVFLVRSSKSGIVGGPSGVGVCGSSGDLVKKSVNVGKVLDLMGFKGSASIDNGDSMEGASGVQESATVQNGSSGGSSRVQESAIVQNSSSGESSGVQEPATVQNGSSEGSPKVNRATLVESGYSSEGSPGVKASANVENDFLKENGHRSGPPVIIMNFPRFDKSEDVENSHSLQVSPEPPKPNVEDKSDTQHLTPEELFQQKNITVECRIEYIYMTSDPIPDEGQLDHSKLILPSFRDLFTSGQLSDITLKCEDVYFPCHKAILCTRSKLFREFVDKEASSDLVLKPNQEKKASSDLVLKLNLDLTTAKALLLYVYTDELDVIETKDECLRLYKASVLFGIPGLKELCLAFLKDICDEEVCVIEESPTKLNELPLSICLEDDKAPVGEQEPVSNIGTQTLTSN